MIRDASVDLENAGWKLLLSARSLRQGQFVEARICAEQASNMLWPLLHEANGVFVYPETPNDTTPSDHLGAHMTTTFDPLAFVIGEGCSMPYCPEKLASHEDTQRGYCLKCASDGPPCENGVRACEGGCDRCSENRYADRENG